MLPIERDIEFGFLVSLIGHALVAMLFFKGYFFHSDDFGKQTIYSVTLEGGQSLGGISQVPDEKSKTQIAPPKKIDSQEEVKKTESKEDAEVSLKEEKKKETEKKEKPEDKKVEKVKEPVKQEEKKEVKKEAQTGTDVNKQLQKAMQRYLGESTDAGGKGFGAGAIGGKGMGGGVVMPESFHRYKKLLQDKIKSGWRWYDTSAALMSEAIFDISPEGDISNVKISKTSGSSEFDDSVERAILKASPLPPPPNEVYIYFKTVRMIFDPKDL